MPPNKVSQDPRIPNKSAEQIGQIPETQGSGRTNRRNSETQQIGGTNRRSCPNLVAGLGGGGVHVCLLWQQATHFFQASAEGNRVPELSRHYFEQWAHQMGISLDAILSPWLHLGRFHGKRIPFWVPPATPFPSGKTSSSSCPSTEQHRNLPVWHSAPFRGTKMNTYTASSLNPAHWSGHTE